MHTAVAINYYIILNRIPKSFAGRNRPASRTAIREQICARLYYNIHVYKIGTSEAGGDESEN